MGRMSEATFEAPTLRALEFDTADRMRKALRAADVSVGEMADYLGVSRNTVGRYINGHVAPDMRTLRVWAMRCGVPYDWLAHGIAPSRLVKLPHLDSNQEPSALPTAPAPTGTYEFPADAEPDILTLRKAIGLNGTPRHGARVPDHPNRVR